MLLVNSKCDHVAYGLDEVMGNDIKRGQRVEMYLTVCQAVREGNEKAPSAVIPQRIKAREMMGARTIWSMGFSLGSDCRDNRV